jgi:DNA-binding NarL/FixJ family response regulator
LGDHAKHLQAQFGFTDTELKVALSMAEGLCLKQIASRHSVAITTVRSQAVAIMGKTATTRQAETIIAFACFALRLKAA